MSETNNLRTVDVVEVVEEELAHIIKTYLELNYILEINPIIDKPFTQARKYYVTYIVTIQKFVTEEE